MLAPEGSGKPLGLVGPAPRIGVLLTAAGILKVIYFFSYGSRKQDKLHLLYTFLCIRLLSRHRNSVCVCVGGCNCKRTHNNDM